MSQPIQTAICSFGMSGKVFHAPFIHVNPGFNLYGVWERSKKTAHTIYPEVKSFDTYEEMLNDATIDLIIVNTPNATHFDFTKQALLAGKHVIVEKPFVINSSEGVELQALAEKQQKKIFVYHNRRYDSEFKILKQVIDGNLTGDIAEAEIHYDRFKKELSPKVHKETPGPGAGLLYDLGSHLIDMALQLFGKPTAVFGDVAIVRPFSKVDDYFEILFYYPAMRVRLRASNLVKEPLPSFVIHGSKGSFIKSRADVQENELIDGKMPEGENWGIVPEGEEGLLVVDENDEVKRTLLAAPAGNYREYFDAVYNCLRNNGPVPVSAEEGTEVVKMIEAVLKSSDTKQVVQL